MLILPFPYNNKNYLLDESLSYITTVINTLYESEKSMNKSSSFKDAYMTARMYEYFIKGRLDEKIISEIIDSLDYSLVKKFNKSKDLYRTILMRYFNEGYES
jgi:hypothetical protein